jgi:hypothetical protein
MFLGSRARSVHRADFRTAISELADWTIWDPQYFTTLYSSTACYGDSFTVTRGITEAAAFMKVTFPFASLCSRGMCQLIGWEHLPDAVSLACSSSRLAQQNARKQAGSRNHCHHCLWEQWEAQNFALQTNFSPLISNLEIFQKKMLSFCAQDASAPICHSRSSVYVCRLVYRQVSCLMVGRNRTWYNRCVGELMSTMKISTRLPAAVEGHTGTWQWNLILFMV